MEQQAAHLLAVLKNSNVPLEAKLELLGKLKADVKHHHVPDVAVSPSFEVVRVAISMSQLLDAGFSMLSHLTKRLLLQEQQSILAAQASATYPAILERMGDTKDRVRLRAIQAFADFWAASPLDVEQVIRDAALSGKNGKAKEAGMQWIVKMNKEQGLQFRSFVPKIVDCLEDADGIVRETAKATIIELFHYAPDHAKSDLKRQLQQRGVRKTIVTYVLTQLGLNVPAEPDLSASIASLESETSRKDDMFNSSISSKFAPAPHIPSLSEQEAEQLDAIYVNSARELEEIFREMHPHFEGKESEQNWSQREKSIIKLRRITKGNAPHDLMTPFLVGIKGLLDGILKTVHSLRTTVSSNGCHFVQDLARVAGSGIDSMVEILLQSLIKLCGGTKTISAQNGNLTVNAILANVTYHARLMQHIWSACQDKNVRPRSYASLWLKTTLTKHGHHKSVLEHANGLELIEKCVKKGLTDANPAVRESMRPTYWAFWRIWPERAEIIMGTLELVQQEFLMKDPSNPGSTRTSVPSNAAEARTHPMARSTTATAPRPSVREVIAAQKRAKLAGLERPGSAQSVFTPGRLNSSSSVARPGTSMANAPKAASSNTLASNSQVGSLSSAPVRPSRPAKRPEMTRPATADPYANRNMLNEATPSISPAGSPEKLKGRMKTPAQAKSWARSKTVAAKPDSPAASPIKTATKPVFHTEASIFEDEGSMLRNPPSPTKAAEDFTMVMPNMKSLSLKAATPSAREILDFETNDHTAFSHSQLERPHTAHIPVPVSSQTGSTRKWHATHNSTSSIPSPRSPHQRPLTSGHAPISQPFSAGIGLGSPKASLSLDENLPPAKASPTRKSASPQAIFSRKENRAYQEHVMQPRGQLKVYEDPEQNNDNEVTPRPATRPTVLEELPVNEPTGAVMLGEATTDKELRSMASPLSRKAETREGGNTGESEKVENPFLARKMLHSGIVRIQARTLDVHGFRKLQGLVRSRTDIWEDGVKFDELLLALLDNLEAPDNDAGKVQDLRTQVLITIRLLLQHHTVPFAPFYPRALCALLVARKYYDGNKHIVTSLNETAETIVAQTETPDLCVDAVMDLLDTIEEHQDKGAGVIHTVSMSLFALAGLLHRNSFARPIPDSPEESRLARLAVRCLGASDSDIRLAAMEFSIELHDLVESPGRFWGLIASAGEDHRALITYYLARKKKPGF